MLDELKDYINDNPKYQWWVYMLIKIGVMVGVFTLLALCSCSTTKVTSHTIQRDTIYIDRVVEIEKLVRDTIISKDTIIEYSLDTLGNWKPSKKIIGSGLKIGASTEQSKEYITENSTSQSEINTETKEKKPNVWGWFGWGAFAGVAGLFILRFIISRI